MVHAHRAGWELSLLRGFELRWREVPIDVPVSSQRLVAFLALHRRAPNRACVAGTLWPDTAETRAAANLRTALWRLHSVAAGVVRASAVNLALHPDVHVDVRALEALAHRLLHESEHVDLRAVDPQALAGELLPELWEAWLVVERERVRQVSLHALEAVSRQCLEAGLYAHAVLAGAAAVEAEPLRESANKLLVAAHRAEGNTSEAIRHWRRYVCLLRDELGLEPSWELVCSPAGRSEPLTRSGDRL